MPTTEYPKNPNVDTAFVTDDNNKRNRALKTVLVDGTIDYPSNSNSTGCYVTIDGKKQRAMMTADISSAGTLEYPENSNSTKGYVDINGKKQRVILTAAIAGSGTPINNQDISVTENGTYTADEGYTGLGTVEVNVPNPSTGTITITSNGITDVTNYANANVQVPTTAPDYYIGYTKDANDKLTKGSNLISFNGIKDFTERCLYYAYYNNTNISGSVNMPALTGATGKSGLESAFYGCTGLTSVSMPLLTNATQNVFNNAFYGCKGITSVSMPLLKTVASSACGYMFYGCTGITSVDLSSLETISNYTCSSMFSGCTGLTSISLPALKMVESSGCSSMFQNCTGLTSISLPALEYIDSNWNNACSSMFGDCTGLTTVALNLKGIKATSGCQTMFQNCTGLTSADLSQLIFVMANTGLNRIFYNCTSLTSVNLSRLTKITGNNALQTMFQNCTSLTDLRFNGLAYNTALQNSAFPNMLSGVDGCTVHFPAEWQTTMSSWANVTGGFGGTNTTVLFDLPNVTTLDLSNVTIVNRSGLFSNFAYSSFPNITSVDLSNLKYVTERGCNNMFRDSTSLTSFDLSSLVSVSYSGGCENMFTGCTALTSASLPSLVMISGGCDYMFAGCTALTSASLPSLKQSTSFNGLREMFASCTSLTDLKFPALKAIVADSFSGMLNYVTGCTVHFPSNLSNLTFNLGGTNNTVVFDLPATVILTGVNTTKYERNPRYDTATALAWRVKDTGSWGKEIVDWTPFYTSGTTDPAVSDTIYSDSACTNAVTTIDSIA